jgi:hypothetical protein
MLNTIEPAAYFSGNKKTLLDIIVCRMVGLVLLFRTVLPFFDVIDHGFFVVEQNVVV